MYLSKSDFLLFLKHPAWLWLKKHEPEKLPAVNESLQAIFDDGNLFETYAEQLFTDAVKLGFDSYDEYKTLTERTKEAIDGGAEAILQGRFEAGEITCICDVLKKVGENTFDLYEIKSSSEVKKDHGPDLAFQKEVIEQNGYKVNKVFVIHVNNKFVRNGEVKAEDLCKICEVTKEVAKLEKATKINIEEALKVAKLDTCPDISPANCKNGSVYDWLPIYKQLAELDEYSIYHLCSPDAGKLAKLEYLGAKTIHDIPDDFELNDKQRRQVITTKTGEVLADKIRIKSFLDSLQYPLFFLDYETLSGIVPYFDGHRPYMQVPFQYSLHVLQKPEGEVVHFEYLHSDNSDPVLSLSESLKSQIGDSGTVLVWYQPFEKGCNQLMGRLAPEYKEFYKMLNSRIVDLMVPFADGAYAHKDFFGSASIKNVLPVLVPELSYKDLDIKKGDIAQRLWMEAILEGKHDDDKKQKILDDLLKYCKLDTLAMVRIFQFLASL